MVERKTISSKLFDITNFIILMLITLLCIIPLWYILCISLSERTAVNSGLVTLWPMGFNLFSYEKIMGDSAFFASFWTSVKRIILGGGVGVGAILLTAYPLSKNTTQFSKRNIFMWILVFCMLFNGGMIPWYLTMRNYGLVDNIWGLVLSGSLPVFNVIIVVNFFRNLPSALEEAAYVDGAGPWKTFFLIFIPLSKPVIATIVLFTVVGHWNEFFQGLVLNTKQANYPLQTYIQQMIVPTDLSNMNVNQIEQAMKLNNRSLDAAKIFIAMLPILFIYPFLQKYFITGITLGSVKE